ncbi:MAG: hypothetical protein ACOCV1_04160 [Bacillota bacterium]
MKLYNKVFSSIKENKSKRERGEIISIPWSGLPKLSKAIPGVIKENYCIVTANQKVESCPSI